MYPPYRGLEDPIHKGRRYDWSHGRAVFPRWKLPAARSPKQQVDKFCQLDTRELSLSREVLRSETPRDLPISWKDPRGTERWWADSDGHPPLLSCISR